MSETADDTIASARAAYERITGASGDIQHLARRRSAGRSKLGKRLTRIALADAAILVAATVIGLFLPLGIFGALAVMLLLIATTVALAIYPSDAPVSYERLRQTDLRVLPQQTGRWLDAQRPALPAPARTIVDQIGVRLDTLQFQLASLDEGEPVAAEVRKLVGEQLPEFVKDYRKVPDTLRSVPRNGRTPDAQLADGLTLIDRELAEMSDRLAQGDLDTLATRGRYLEIKYRGDGGG